MTVNANLSWRKFRKCNGCNKIFYARYNTHRKWCRKTNKPVYCGTMRVIRYPEKEVPNYEQYL